jgi:dTDP-glucose pyrophosphorylase
MIRVIIFNMCGIDENCINENYKNLLYATFNDLQSRGYILYAVDNISVKDLNRKILTLGFNTFLKTPEYNDLYCIKDYYLKIILNTIDHEINSSDILVVDFGNDLAAGIYNNIKICQRLNLNVCLLNDSESFTDKILESIIYYQDENKSIGKKTLFQKSINIVVPIMGDNTRFLRSSYGMERALIVFGKPILSWVVCNLQIDANYIFIIREHLCRLHKIDKILESMYPDCTIIKSESKTEGNVCSIIMAEKYINNDNPLIVINDNQWLQWNVEEYITDFLLGTKSYLQLITFRCCGDNSFHYIKTEDSDDKNVLSIMLNTPVNEYALTEVYFWRHGKDFVKYAHRMNSQNKRIFGEFSTTLITNEVLDDIKNNILPQGSVIHRICDKYFPFREEHELKSFYQWYIDDKRDVRIK